MTDSLLDLDRLSADVEWVDPAAARAAREYLSPAEGRLAAVHEWLAATQGAFPVHEPGRARCVVLAPVTDAVTAVCDGVGLGVRELVPDRSWTVQEALAAGAAAADSEVDAGTDLLVVADPDDSPVAAVVISALTGAEPVTLLPRGRQAVDTARWVARAEHLRDSRRRVAGMAHRPDQLLLTLDNAPLAATAGLIARATARRTPLLLDGTAALAAALLTSTAQPRAGQWWQAADASPDPAHGKAVTALGVTPLLALGAVTGDGIAGALAVPLVRAAAQLGRHR